MRDKGREEEAEGVLKVGLKEEEREEEASLGELDQLEGESRE